MEIFLVIWTMLTQKQNVNSILDVVNLRVFQSLFGAYRKRFIELDFNWKGLLSLFIFSFRFAG